jgi:xanthine dehydrogenase molybdenum-binding subunit
MGRGAVSTLKPAPAFAVQLVDLALDAETGKVTLLRYTGAQDCGRAVNPPAVEGQIQGGIAQGIGWALTEEMIYAEDGRLLNPTFLDYRMPVALDLPRLETILVEVPAEDGPYGIRGVGEAPIVPPPAAIAAALRRLTGRRALSCPMTPEAVWRNRG